MSGDFVERQSETYRNLSDKYAKQIESYKQYYKIYIVRLDTMTKNLLHEIQRKWKDDYPICKLYQLSEESYDKCIVIGTLFKNQKLKPSVLKQLAESNSLMPQPIAYHRTDDSDTLHIEDELQRYELVIDDVQGFEAKYLVTGISCALLGTDLGQGKFKVIDYVFSGFWQQVDRPILERESYVVLMSGLDLINVHKNMLKLRLLVNWINGFLGDINGVDTEKITRVIIAGNSVKTSNEDNFQKFSMTTRTNQASDTIETIKTLDGFLLELCQVIDVDIMPGQNDPSNYVLPQKPLHHCLFPKSINYKSFNRATNPYECLISNMKFLGTSGQNISDILRYSDISEPIDALENCLKWGHLAPTAPDTLGCFPYYEEDPFIIEDCPHVLFAGNQSKFDTRLTSKVRIVSIPEFSSTSSVVVLNLKNLECSEIVFG